MSTLSQGFALRALLIAHSFNIAFIVLLFSLFYFSSSETRRRPVFILNAFIVVIALAVGVLLDFRSITTILSPQRHIPISLGVVIGAVGGLEWILVDLTLLLRLVSVYAPSIVGKQRAMLIVVFPITLKFLRTINLVFFITALARAARSGDSDESVLNTLLHTPYIRIETIAQCVDNTYASSLLLLSILTRRSSDYISNRISFAQASFMRCLNLKIIFRLAMNSFAFPALFSIAQVVLIFRTSISSATGFEIVLVNTSVAVIGVVFATVWVEPEAQMDEVCRRNSKFSEVMAETVFVEGRPPTIVGSSDVENTRLSKYSTDQQSTFLSLGSMSRNVFMPSRA